MNLDRWLSSARILRAPDDGTGAAAATTPAATDGAPPASAPSSAAPAQGAAPAPSPLATADSSKRDGAPAPKAEAAPEAAPETKSETPAKAGDAPPPGGPEGKDAAKPEGDAAKPDAATGDGKEAKPGETADGKPKEADAAADKKPDAPAEAPPAPPPVYDAYKVPETLKLDDVKLKDFNTILGEAEISGKADHAAMQQLGQKLMDLYAGEVARISQEVQQYQVDVWNRHLEGELNRLKSDPEIGGNRIDTTLGNAKYVLEQFGGSKDEQDRLMTALDRAGVSSNRDFVALLHRMHERYREPGNIPPNLPSPKPNNREAGNRGWYDTVDVGAKA